MKRLTILVVAVTGLVGTLVRAHDTWLIPDQFNLAPNRRSRST